MEEYREVIRTPQMELCTILNLTKLLTFDDFELINIPIIGNYNMSNQMFFENTKNHIKNINFTLMHPCPLFGDDFVILNYSSSTKHVVEKTFPRGDYRYEHIMWNDDDNLVFKKTIFEKFDARKSP